MILPDVPQIWQELAQSGQAGTQCFAKPHAIPKLSVSAGRLRRSLSDERGHIRSSFRALESSRLSPSRRIGSRMSLGDRHRQSPANVMTRVEICLDPSAPTWARSAQSSSSGEQTCHRSKFLSPPVVWSSLPGARCQQTASAPQSERALVSWVQQYLTATFLPARHLVPPRVHCATTQAFVARSTTGLAKPKSQHRTGPSSRDPLSCLPASDLRCAGPVCSLSQRTVAHV
ncbi:MAG: hypothetical protein ACI9AX_000783 [Polaromonas sp.]|jgi:hypothetical protein